MQPFNSNLNFTDKVTEDPLKEYGSEIKPFIGNSAELHNGLDSLKNLLTESQTKRELLQKSMDEDKKNEVVSSEKIQDLQRKLEKQSKLIGIIKRLTNGENVQIVLKCDPFEGFQGIDHIEEYKIIADYVDVFAEPTGESYSGNNYGGSPVREYLVTLKLKESPAEIESSEYKPETQYELAEKQRLDSWL